MRRLLVRLAPAGLRTLAALAGQGQTTNFYSAVWPGLLPAGHPGRPTARSRGVKCVSVGGSGLAFGGGCVRVVLRVWGFSADAAETD